MWTPTLKSVDKVDGQIRLIVIFTEGAETVEKEFRLSNRQALKGLIQTEITRLTDLYQFADSLTPGVIDLTPDAVVPKAQDEQDFEAFLVLYRRWQTAQRLIDLGILTGTEPQLVTLLANVKAAFKPAYVNQL